MASTTRRKPRRSKTPAQLKKELDRVFSIWVRSTGKKECYTCHRKSDTLQCGHFVSRSYLVTRWEPDNCRPQCVGCNLYGSGKPLDFEENLKKEIGAERVEEMKLSRHRILKLTPQWYLSEIERYEGLIHTLTLHKEA